MNKKNKSIQFQRGFSLVEIMVSVGVLGVVSLSMMTMFVELSKSNARTVFSSETTNLHKEIRSVLSSDTACLNTFNGVTLTGSLNHNLLTVRDASNTAVFSAGTTYSNRTVTIQSMTFNTFIPGPNSSGVATLRISYVPMTTLSTHLRVVRDIVIETKHNTSNALISCVARANMSDGIWQIVPTTNFDIQYSTGNVGIGATKPNTALHIVGDGGATDDLTFDSYVNSGPQGWTGTIFFDRASGTVASPLPPIANDHLGSIVFRGYQGGNWQTGGSLAAVAEANYAVANSAGIMITTTSNGSNFERMRISSTGNIGIGTSAPQTRLDVQGAIRPGPAAVGAACGPMGSTAYDITNGAPLYCSNLGAWTPSGGVTGSNTPTGWVRLPNGLMIQWGQFGIPNTGCYPFTYAVPFTSNVFSVTAIPNGTSNGSSTSDFFGVTAIGLSGAQVCNGYNLGYTIYYMAIGL